MAGLRLVWRFSNFPIVKSEHRRPAKKSQYYYQSDTKRQMSVFPLNFSNASGGASTTSYDRKLPILLFDIMDTIVRDPFYDDIPAFFGMTMKELLQCKHPTAWVEFEKGHINEMELARIFFADGRPFDLEGLKTCMKNGYSYIEGIEGLLSNLRANGYEMHACTNYPIWYEMIEEKLKLSTYLSWTFCSCTMGKRKPDPEFYLDVSKQLKVEPSDCIFVDDRMKNVEAAIDVGFKGIQFKDVESLRKDLILLGVNDNVEKDSSNENSADIAACK